MGNSCCRKRGIRRKIVLLLLGLDNAGKTRAANGLAGDPLSSPIPTVGFCVINLKYLNFDVKVFDLGGGPNIRGIWHKYFADTHGLIFVVDSSDFSRFNEARMVLEDILFDPKITGKPLLVLANKQDNENALDEIDVIEYLNIEELVNRQKCPTLVQSCSATEKNSNKLDPGIQKGYEWLLSNVARNYENLNNRVIFDSSEQARKEKEELIAKIKRIKDLQAIENDRKSEDIIETYSDYVKKINTVTINNDEQILNVTTLDNLEVSSKNSSTSSSSISFPPVHISNNCALPERPKSAVQIVKHQLQLNNPSRKPSLKTKSNKTAPINLYGVKLPHSAHERRRNFFVEGRNLKSADATVIIKSYSESNGVDHMGPSGDYHHTKDIFQLNHFGTKLPPLNFKSNAVPWVHKPVNGDVISVIDVD